ncbi:MAG: tRNA (guanine(10)-N(2))-dimethyltransferase [Promethearchaeota archaeon]
MDSENRTKKELNFSNQKERTIIETIKREGEIEFFLPFYLENGKKCEKITNKPEIIRKKENMDIVSKKMPVFYNETMVINRDITEIVIDIYSKILNRKIDFLDLMAASGIRSIRLLKETNCINKIYLNDLNPMAFRYIKKNLEYNKIQKEKYELFNEDAIYLLSKFRKRGDRQNEYIDVIDIDPFGSPSQFIPSAMQAIKLGGLLCVTATDTPVLFGIKKKQCVRKYLTHPIKTDFLKELGTRILIYYTMKIAHIFELYAEPILSISSDHFIRVFFIIKKGIAGINNNINNFGVYAYCPKCLFRDIEKYSEDGLIYEHVICPYCNSKLLYSGFLWLGNLHSKIYQREIYDKIFNFSIEEEKKLKKTFRSINRIKKYLIRSNKEDEFPPYYYSVDKIADLINKSVFSMDKFINNLKNKGFKATRTHFDPMGVKTDATITDIKNNFDK